MRHRRCYAWMPAWPLQRLKLCCYWTRVVCSLDGGHAGDHTAVIPSFDGPGVVMVRRRVRWTYRPDGYRHSWLELEP